MIILGCFGGTTIYGNTHIITQLAVYIPLIYRVIYCLLEGYIMPTTLYKNQNQPLMKGFSRQLTVGWRQVAGCRNVWKNTHDASIKLLHLPTWTVDVLSHMWVNTPFVPWDAMGFNPILPKTSTAVQTLKSDASKLFLLRPGAYFQGRAVKLQDGWCLWVRSF